MKKYLLLLSLFFTLSALGQANYKIELTNLRYDVQEDVKNSTSSNVTITIIYADNSTEQLYYRHIGDPNEDEWGWDLNPPVISGKKPVAVHTSGFVNFRTGTDAAYDQYDAVTVCPISNYIVDTHTPRMTDITFSLKVTPVLIDALVQPLDNAFSTEDALDIKTAFKGFPSFVYNWQFSVTAGSSWLQFPPQYQDVDSSTLTATQLFAGSGLNVSDYIGKNVLIRLNACNGNTLSNIISLNIRKSPPNITAATVTPPRCFDTDDGKVTFTFDRALLPGESLFMNLRDSTHSGLIYFRQLTAADLDAAHAYTFPDNLQPAQYYLVYQGKYTYIDGGGTTITSQSNIKQSNLVEVIAPTAVTFSTNKINVWCYNGNDGSINITAAGGAGNYQYMIKRNGQPDSVWYNFSSSTVHTITGLTAATWLVQVRDAIDCYAKTAAGGTIITQPVVITQPAAPLQNNLVALINPTGFGLADGSIEVAIAGGTPKPDGSYNFEWTTLAGTPITTGITTSVTATGYSIRLSNLPNGTYLLNTNDNNNALATEHTGCTDQDTFLMLQPLPLQVKVAIQDSVLCNGNDNGSLVAHGEGGVKFTSGNPYSYSWKKQDINNVYVIMPSQTDSVATGLTTGWYAVNIKDANGIVLAQDRVFFLPQPALLTVGITHTNATCAGLPNGSATAFPSGGTLPYTYAWNTGETTATINNLVAGTYLVFINDRNNCPTQQHVVITQPNAIALALAKQQPNCFNSCDGKLTASITGGTAPFTYQWTGASAINNIADNLCSGNYQLAVTDANGCSILQKETLINPDALPVALGTDRFICTGQSIHYNITIPYETGITYQWYSTTGFTSDKPKVTLTQAGTYYASVTNSKGCNSKDTLWLLLAGTTISNEFVLPTQAFVNEQVVVVNTSNPLADSVQWLFPAQATAIQRNSNFASFTIADTGAYYVKLITYRGMCYVEQEKKMIVSNRTVLNGLPTNKNPFIKLFTASPNPSSGSFMVRISLETAAAIQLKLINTVTNQVIGLFNQSGSGSYTIPVNVSLVAGTYVLLLETPKASATMKLVLL